MKNKRSQRVSVPSDTLLACPFCGKPGEIDRRTDGYRIGCNNHGCIAGLAWAAKWIKPENGIWAWNQRANAAGQTPASERKDDDN